VEGGCRGHGFPVCRVRTSRPFIVQGEFYCGHGTWAETDTKQAGEFFIENVLKKRRAAAAERAAAELSAVDGAQASEKRA
jgi:hypothetical protein